MSELDTLELTLAVLPEGLVIALEYPQRFGLNRISVVGDYRGLPGEPGIYRACVRPEREDFRVDWYEEVRMEPTGNFIYPLVSV